MNTPVDLLSGTWAYHGGAAEPVFSAWSTNQAPV
jgi:hypothetical protein